MWGYWVADGVEKKGAAVMPPFRLSRLLPHWLRVRLRARCLHKLTRTRLTMELLTARLHLFPSMPRDDAEQIAYLGAVKWLDKRRERVMKVKVRRELRKLGVEVEPEKEWLLMGDEEKEKVLERMTR